MHKGKLNITFGSLIIEHLKQFFYESDQIGFTTFDFHLSLIYLTNIQQLID